MIDAVTSVTPKAKFERTRPSFELGAAAREFVERVTGQSATAIV